jgi:hypothetical protein
MSFTDTLYTARLGYETIQKGRANVLKCRMYRSGSLVAPNSATVSVYDETNTAIVSAASATITGSVATYSLSAGAVSASTLSDGWRVEWALTMPDGVVHNARTAGSLVFRQLYPVVTEADLYRKESALDPSGSAPITSASSWTDKLDEAWADLTDMLLARGRLPWLCMEPSALRRPHQLLTLALIFEDLSSRLDPAYAAKAERYRTDFRAAWAETSFLEADTDGEQVSPQRRSGGIPVLWLSGR